MIIRQDQDGPLALSAQLLLRRRQLMFSATEDMPDDHRSAQEAGADRDPLGGGLNLALSLWSEARVLWNDCSEPDGEPDRRRHNDYHQNQQE